MSAVISNCGTYRYSLSRLGTGNAVHQTPLLFLMLNPSTADASDDDPTIGRCRSFAQGFGYDGLVVGNLYALRFPSSAALWLHGDPIGPENNAYLAAMADEYKNVICAWGAAANRNRAQEVADIFLRAGAKLWCLGTTKSGAPLHPLYVKGSQPLVEWTPVSR
ncbi:DUF1643 domain-containing protein [Kerstersia gyiorum]|uniref:DUF1643 domain-containing protein n=1 Tax=Kerstersia gyiorum TaxID=206506 RepID=UPI001070CE75|nr:DUF1643 domain-containing protein [Kerstersia gyiorum]QBR40570.1 DUF1643 domain-containing protein [Kerstersia gyiorum]